MSYQITFAPPAEKMEEYKDKDFNFPRNNTAGYKKELLSICMHTPKDSPMYLQTSLTALVKCLQSSIEREQKESIYNQWKENENHEIWFCGWQYAREATLTNEEIVASTVDNLFIYCDLVQTPDYFDDHEKFYEKLNNINEEIDGFEESIIENYNHFVINDLHAYKVGGEDESSEENAENN